MCGFANQLISEVNVTPFGCVHLASLVVWFAFAWVGALASFSASVLSITWRVLLRLAWSLLVLIGFAGSFALST